jgi:hypothetical protein
VRGEGGGLTSLEPALPVVLITWHKSGGPSSRNEPNDHQRKGQPMFRARASVGAGDGQERPAATSGTRPSLARGKARCSEPQAGSSFRLDRGTGPTRADDGECRLTEGLSARQQRLAELNFEELGNVLQSITPVRWNDSSWGGVVWRGSRAAGSSCDEFGCAVRSDRAADGGGAAAHSSVTAFIWSISSSALTLT